MKRYLFPILREFLKGIDSLNNRIRLLYLNPPDVWQVGEQYLGEIRLLKKGFT